MTVIFRGFWFSILVFEMVILVVLNSISHVHSYTQWCVCRDSWATEQNKMQHETILERIMFYSQVSKLSLTFINNSRR